MMDAAVEHGELPMIANITDWKELYKPLPYIFLALLLLWTIFLIAWSFNTWTKRRWQSGNLQWILTSVPILKVLVLALSFAFWYPCLNLNACSFWVAFGVFVSRIFFETACFSTFMLIAHGYCIVHEQLSVTQRHSIAALGFLFYLILTGYKAAVPQFSVLVVLMYGVLYYVIMARIARNLSVLREQLQHIENAGVHTMHSAIYTKYIMFKRFQTAIFMVVVGEFMIHAVVERMGKEYWMRLLIREFTEGVIFFHIGWTFRSRGLTPLLTLIPSLHSSRQYSLPPIYSVEMNAKEFKNLDYEEWHIGVPTSITKGGVSHKQMLVIVQNPGMLSSVFVDNKLPISKNPENVVTISASSQFCAPSVFLCSTNHNCAGTSSSASSSSSSSSSEHEGLELNIRGSTNLTNRSEPTGVPTDNSGKKHSKDGRKCTGATAGANEEHSTSSSSSIVREITVDMKGLKSSNSCYSFLPFENVHNSDPRVLHSRSNTNLQSFVSHHTSAMV